MAPLSMVACVALVGCAQAFVVPLVKVSTTSLQAAGRPLGGNRAPSIDVKEDVEEVWDAEGGYSWDTFKATTSPEASLSDTDLLNCFETDECAVPDGKFTGHWSQLPYKAARDSETYTVFEGDAEYEVEKPWGERWFEEAGSEMDMDAAAAKAKADGQYDI